MKESEIVNLIEDEELRRLIIERRKIKRGRPKLEKSVVNTTARASLYCEPELLAKVRVIAAKEDKSIRAVLVESVREHVRTYEATNGEIHLKTT